MPVTLPLSDDVDRVLRVLIKDGHAMRVMDLASMVCSMMGVTGLDNFLSIRRGALFHDVGKCCIPERILVKPARLTAHEQEVMRRHAELGAEIVRALDMEADAIIPLHHHERWDGSGYPNRLAGTDIPLVARAFAPIDVYDALRSPRYYPRYKLDGTVWKAPLETLTHAEAMEIVEAGSGTAFDPHAVAAFSHAICMVNARTPREEGEIPGATDDSRGIARTKDPWGA